MNIFEAIEHIDQLKVVETSDQVAAALILAELRSKATAESDAVERAIMETRDSMEEGQPRWFCRVETLREWAEKNRALEPKP
jgi:hypothetical protein